MSFCTTTNVSSISNSGDNVLRLIERLWSFLCSARPDQATPMRGRRFGPSVRVPPGDGVRRWVQIGHDGRDRLKPGAECPRQADQRTMQIEIRQRLAEGDDLRRARERAHTR